MGELNVDFLELLLVEGIVLLLETLTGLLAIGQLCVQFLELDLDILVGILHFYEFLIQLSGGLLTVLVQKRGILLAGLDLGFQIDSDLVQLLNLNLLLVDHIGLILIG